MKQIDCVIPENKLTAIVGPSGSGKTTLINLLLRFYHTADHAISVGDVALNALDHAVWRSHCGVVLQESYLFSNTLLQNIVLANSFDQEKLDYALEMSNIDFLHDLPLGLNTPIGRDGVPLSKGQKQRILIARAVYKNPSYVFFDEATSALDANNEDTILQKLQPFWQDKTVIMITHSLLSVKQADQIIVMNQGEVLDAGRHDELIVRNKLYRKLLENQMAIAPC